jgi:hypothetical protein
MFKLLISSLILATMTGCVSPYYSMADPYQGAYDENGYYENSYAGPSTYVQSTAYLGAAYYPYWSMDYFYLGSHYYRPSYGTSYSISLSSGYPYYGPYYYPDYYSSWYAPYSYYNPWFGMHYSWGSRYGHYDPYWRHGYGSHAWRSPRYGHFGGYDRRHGSGGYDRGRESYRNDGRVGNNVGARPGRDSRQVDDYRRGGQRVVQDREPPVRDRADRGRTHPARANRNVSLAPSRTTTDRGMVVVKHIDGKPGPNRLGPVTRHGSTYGSSRLPAPGSSPAVANQRSEQSRIVAPNDNKVGRSRTGIPVRSGNPAPAVWVNPDRSVTQSRPAAPRAAPPQRTNREPAARSYSRNSNSNSNSNRQPPSDSGDDAGRSERDAGEQPDRGRRKGHR